jgi:hypothetical protein
MLLVACGGEDVGLDDEIDPPGTIDATVPDYGRVSDAGGDSGESADAGRDSGDAAVQTCPVGLRPGRAGCVSAVPGDPVFTDPSAWSTFGGAVVADELVLDRNAICTPGGSGASTTIELGAYDEVGPLFVTIDLRYDLCDKPGAGACEPSSILFVRLGESIVEIPTPFGLGQPERSVSFCLPSSAYGSTSEIDIWFREFEEDACADTDQRTVAEAIQSVRIAQVGDTVCPAPGAFDDPEFEVNIEGREPIAWDVNTGGTGAIEVGGAEDDREAVLTLNTGCSNAQMQQTTRIPTPTDPRNGVAFRFDQRATEDTPLQVRLGPFQRYLVDLQPGELALCLPSYLWGRAEEVLFRVTGTTDCTESLNYKVAIDDLEFVELPECGPPGSIRNGAFDTEPLTTWNVSTNGPDATVGMGAQGQAVLATTATCGAATLEQWVTPRGEPNALRFRYRGAADGEHAYSIRTLGFPTFMPQTLQATPDWETVTTCLPGEPRLPVNVSFTEFSASMACGAPFATSLEIDDVELVVASECP